VRIGIPRERKDGERRVGLTPAGVRALCGRGHDVTVEHDAGVAVGFADADYAAAGAQAGDAAHAWSCELIVKVKEIQPGEYASLRAGQAVLGFAQLNRDPALLRAVLAAGTRTIAYETVRDAAGGLPLLAPMSRISGRLAPLVGAQALGTDRGGAGVLITGLGGVAAARVVVIGAGEVARESARIAARLGCAVQVFSRGRSRLEALGAELERAGTPVRTLLLADAPSQLPAAIAQADLVIGAVLEPGKLSPKLVTRAMLRSMRAGSALVDVGIDQGGIAETSRMTTLSAPTYVEEGVVHYAVANMPALVARTATLALEEACLPRVLTIAEHGLAGALEGDAGLAAGVMTWGGAVVHPGLAADCGYDAHAAPWRTQLQRHATPDSG